MARLTTSPFWSPLDDAPGRNLAAPRASHLAAVIGALNHIAGRNLRLLFCQHYVAVPTVADPMCRFRYNQNYVNGRRLDHRVLAFPPFTAEPAPGTAVPTVRSSVGNQTTMRSVEPSPATDEPADLRSGAWYEDIAVGGVYANRSIGTLNGYQLKAVAVYERADQGTTTLDSTWGASIDPSRGPRSESIVRGDLTYDLRALEARLWLVQRPVVAAWSAPGFAAGDARSLTGTTTPTNLMEGAGGPTARTANTPGEVCPVQYAGRAALAYVNATVAVYADTSAGTGTVQFVSSRNTVTLSVPGGGAAWVTSSNGALELDTTVEDEKVDILFAPDTAANTIRVWAYMIMVHPL